MALLFLSSKSVHISIPLLTALLVIPVSCILGPRMCKGFCLALCGENVLEHVSLGGPRMTFGVLLLVLVTPSAAVSSLRLDCGWGKGPVPNSSTSL